MAAQRAVLAASPRCTGYFGCYPTGLFRQTLAGHAADYAALSALSPEARRQRLAAIQVQFADVQRQLQQEMTMSGLQEFLYLTGGGMVNWGAGMWDGYVLGSLDLLNMVFSCSDTCREPFQPTKKIGVVGDPDIFGPSYAVGEWNLVAAGLAGLGKKLLTRSAEKVAAEAATAEAAKAAANTAGTASRGLTTFYPPNRGFLGNSSRQTLEAGTQIDRYGREGGTFVSPSGTPFEMRALPPGAGARPYNVYEVVEPFAVDAGTVAPWHSQLGLGIQYELPGSVADLIEQGFLKAVN